MIFLSLLLSVAAHAAAPPPELLCDPEAKVTFQSRWVRSSTVLLTGDVKWELPWTGKEEAASGKQLKAESPEELTELDDEISFEVFKKPGGGPLETLLFIQKGLLDGSNDDGLVIAELLVSASIENPAPKAKMRVYHCRAR